MSKQTFKLDKKQGLRILTATSSFALAAASIAMLFPVVSNRTYADGDSSDSIVITSGTNLDFNLESPESGNTLAIAKDTVSVSTGAGVGYELYLSSLAPTMYKDNEQTTADNAKIVPTAGTYNVPAALNSDTASSWGYALPGINNFDANYSTTSPADTSKFAAVPLDASRQLIKKNNDSATGEQTDVYYGVKLNQGIKAGSYAASAIYTTVAKVNSYTVRFDAQGGSAVDSISRTYGQAVGTLPNTTRDDYDFEGWFTSPEGGNQISSETTITGDTVFYAHWTETSTDPRTPKALLGYNNNLLLVYDDQTHYAYEQYSDSIGSTYLKAVFDVPTNSTQSSDIGWDSRTDIYSVEFDDSFKDFKPSSTAYWFHGLKYLGRGSAYNDPHSVINTDNLDMSKVTNASYMFDSVGGGYYSGSTAYVDVNGIGDWDVSKITNMSHMFNGNIRSLDDLSEWDVSKATDMSYMFAQVSAASIGDIGGWEVGNVTNMSYMFKSFGGYRDTFDLGDLDEWDVSKVTDMSYMFSWAGSDTSSWNVGDLSGWDVGQVTTMAHMFEESCFDSDDCSVGPIGERDGWDISNVTDISYMFSGFKGYIGDLGNWETDNVTTMEGTFEDVRRLPINIGSWTVDNVTNMSRMFYGAYNDYYDLAWDIGDLSQWNTGNVTNMSKMFMRTGGYSATDWHVGGIEEWDVSHVTDMSYMFSYVLESARNVNLTEKIGGISGWDVSSVENFSHMFERANYASIDTDWIINLGGWEVGNATDMSYMFNESGHSINTARCEWNVGELDGWDVGNVTNMEYMFANSGQAVCIWIVGDLGGWEVGNVTNMSHMFYGSGRGTIPLVGVELSGFNIGNLDDWDVSSVTDMTSMFEDAGQFARNWNIGTISGWHVDNVTAHDNFFSGQWYATLPDEPNWQQ